MTITSILTNYEFVFYGISILIVILLIFASVKFMFMLPSKGKQKYYKVAYFIMVALLIAYISLIFYETSTKAFSIIKIMDYLFPFIIIAYLAYYFRKRSKEKIKKVKIGKNSEKKLKFNPVSKHILKLKEIDFNITTRICTSVILVDTNTTLKSIVAHIKNSLKE